jgi:hypothetical protein
LGAAEWQVYRALDKLGRPVAIRILSDAFALESDATAFETGFESFDFLIPISC